MGRKRYTTEQIITKPREAEVRFAQEKRVVQAEGDNRAHLLPVEAIDSLSALWPVATWRWRAGRARSQASVRSGLELPRFGGQFWT